MDNGHQEFRVTPGAPISAQPDNATGGAPGGCGGGSGGKTPSVVRSYRSKEDVWARSRRKNVPKRVLEDLLAAWRAGMGGMTPAEYGAAFIGPQVTSGVHAKARRWCEANGRRLSWEMDSKPPFCNLAQTFGSRRLNHSH